MVVSEDGKNDKGRKEEKKGGRRTDGEVTVSDEKVDGGLVCQRWPEAWKLNR